MKVKKQPGRRRRHAVKGGTVRLTSSPPDTADNGLGILRPNTGDFRLPDALIEAGDNRERGLMPGRVSLTIAALALIFIAIITWFVSQMPDK